MLNGVFLLSHNALAAPRDTCDMVQLGCHQVDYSYAENGSQRVCVVKVEKTSTGCVYYLYKKNAGGVISPGTAPYNFIKVDVKNGKDKASKSYKAVQKVPGLKFTLDEIKSWKMGEIPKEKEMVKEKSSSVIEVEDAPKH